MGKKVLNHRRALYAKLIWHRLWIGICIFVLVINLGVFIQKLSLNAAKLTDYQSVQDPLERYRDSLDVIVFYDIKRQNTPKIMLFNSLFDESNIDSVLNFLRPVLGRQKIVTVDLPEKKLELFKKHASEGYLDFTTFSPDSEALFNPDFWIKPDNRKILLLVFNNSAQTKQKIIRLARYNQYKPKAFSIYKTVAPQSLKLQDDELKRELSNLQDFIKDHQTQLQILLQDPFASDFKDVKHFYDRSSLFVQQADSEYMFLDFEHSLISAYRKIYRQLKIKETNQTPRVFLLTQMRLNPSTDEEGLIRLLKDGQGLYIEEGLRHAVMMPGKLQNTEQKKEFLHQLKIKAGLNLDYWSENLKTYTFYAQEI